MIRRVSVWTYCELSCCSSDSRNVRFGVYVSFVATVEYGDFEWDDAKAESNLAKHGVSFEEAAWAMKDPLSLDFDDLVDPANLITLAAWPAGRILYIVSTVRDERIRIISARTATSNERRRYEEAD